MSKLLKMFTAVHGDPGEYPARITGNCYIEEAEDGLSVAVMKDGALCWELSREDIVFEYLTKDWGE